MMKTWIWLLIIVAVAAIAGYSGYKMGEKAQSAAGKKAADSSKTTTPAAGTPDKTEQKPAAQQG